MGIGPISNFCTFGAVQLMKFVTGEEALTNESWDAYLETLDQCGYSDVLAVYQSAYDAYLND